MVLVGVQRSTTRTRMSSGVVNREDDDKEVVRQDGP